MNENESQKQTKIKKIKEILKKSPNYIKKIININTYKIVLLIISIIIITSKFTIFGNDVKKKINQNTKVYLKSIVNESVDRVTIKMNQEFGLLNSIGISIYNAGEYDSRRVSNILSDQLDYNSFVGIAVYDTEGNEINKIGDINLDIEADCFANAMSGENSISTVFYDEENGLEYIELAVPIMEDDQIDAVLVCNYDLNEFIDFISNSPFEDVGSTFIAQEDGVLVCKPESVKANTNLYTLLDKINTEDSTAIKKLKKSIKKEESGIITYGSGKLKRYICYNTIPETDWYSISIVSASAIEPVAKKVTKLAWYLSVQITSIFAINFAVILFIDYKIVKKRKMTNQVN